MTAELPKAMVSVLTNHMERHSYLTLFSPERLVKTTTKFSSAVLVFRMEQFPFYWPQFYTVAILNWQFLLRSRKYKQIIVDSLKFLVDDKRITLYAFLIMDNHIHLIWQVLQKDRDKVQLSFMKFTAQQIKFDLIACHPQVLEKFKVKSSDRSYQFWQRRALSINLYSHAVFLQKLDYLHNNPVKAGLCEFPEDYYFSSASSITLVWMILEC